MPVTHGIASHNVVCYWSTNLAIHGGGATSCTPETIR
jgi:hypothetical protein